MDEFDFTEDARVVMTGRAGTTQVDVQAKGRGVDVIKCLTYGTVSLLKELNATRRNDYKSEIYDYADGLKEMADLLGESGYTVINMKELEKQMRGEQE